jgi:hypothetical protein
LGENHEIPVGDSIPGGWNAFTGSGHRPPVREALEASGNKNFEVDELPGLNHLFQTAKTGAVSEYAEIEETMSPTAMEKVATWIWGLKVPASQKVARKSGT